MTAQIVYGDSRTRRHFLPDHRFDADAMQHLSIGATGQLWERVAEGKRRD